MLLRGSSARSGVRRAGLLGSEVEKQRGAVGGGNVKQPRHGTWMVLQVMCYDYWARADDFWKGSYQVDEESAKCESPSFR
jgi:hypothetical protein